MADSLDTCSSCEEDVSNVRVEENSNNVTLQVGSGRHDIIESVSKNSAQAGVGVSLTGPSVNGKIESASEIKSAKNEIDSVSVNIPLDTGPTIVWVENPDPNNEDVISGCLTDGCDNNIVDKINRSREKLNEISQSIDANDGVGKQDLKEMMDDKSFVDPSTLSLDEISSTKESKERDAVGRYIAKARNGVGTVVSKARSGASSAASRVRSGLSTTVDRATQQFENDETMLHVSPSDDASVTFSEGNNEVAVSLADRETETPGTTVHVATNNEMVNTSYDEDRTVTVGIADEADATIAVSPGADENEPPTVGGDDIQFSFDDGDIRVSPHDDSGIPMATDENGIIQMTVGDGHTTSEPSNEKTAEQDTTPETAQDIDPTTSSTRDPIRDEPSKSVDGAASANGAATDGTESNGESNTKWIGSDPPENLPSWIEMESQRTDDDDEEANPNAAIGPDRENTDDDTPSRIG